MIKHLLSFICLISLACQAYAQAPMTSRSSEGKPLYEVGIGGGGFYSPHYPGSDQSRDRYLFLPYFVYRGKYLKADDDGVRGEFLYTKKYQVDLSFSAAFPADSTDNIAREGMPDLDWIGEVGPRFLYHAYKNTEDKTGVDVSLPLRAVLSTDFGRVKGHGFVFHPTVSFRKEEFLFKKLILLTRFGFILATEETMDYFYEVKPWLSTVSREIYDAKAGYMESHIDLAFSYELSKDKFIFIGFQQNIYAGADNVDSPLHRDKYTNSIAVGFAWTFYKSEQLSGAWY